MVASLIVGDLVNAAAYKGYEIDEELYGCTAYSYSANKSYDLTCEFSGDEVILYFSQGRNIITIMDSVEIENPNLIRVYDYGNDAYWKLSLNVE